MIGKNILHYRIIEKLGEGGMGIVYLAEDSKLKRQVAIKFLPHHISANSDERKRFEIEAQAAAALNHPNIATVYNIEESDDELFIVMEYIKGRHLKEHVGLKPLSAAEALKTAEQIAYGLQEAHNKGVVHRDIKSSNIMIDANGRAKIMDFGLAKVGSGIELTKTQSTLGTAAYMSPEQAKGEDVDQRSDIWSFGVVFYEMLTGTLPFKGDYEQAVIFNILNEEPADPEIKIPDELNEIIRKALNKNPSDRYASTDLLLADIKALNKEKDNHNIVSVLKKPIVTFSVLIFLLLITWWIYNNAQVNHVRQNILPQIEKLSQDIISRDNGSLSWQAFELAEQASEIIPEDPALLSYFSVFSNYINIKSEPIAVKAYAKAYSDSGMQWKYLGETPLDSINFPIGFSKLKLEKEGFRTVYDIIWNASYLNTSFSFILPPANDIPDEMVFIPSVSTNYEIAAAPAGLHMPGLEQMEPVNTGDFLMDRFEVTNHEYKTFVDDGGYKNRKWWRLLLSENPKGSWENTIPLFVDKTGQPGPANWEVGDYAQGQADYPVSGISLFEAAAYADYIGKSLPTIWHWDRVALTWASQAIVPLSNLAAKGLVKVGSKQSMNRFGVFDMSGNVREWCINKSSRGGYFILGGGWNDPAYAFNDAYAAAGLDRSETNGFRCIKYVGDNVDHQKLEAVINLPFRDFLNEKPVSDATFELFLKQFAYDKSALNAVLEGEEEDNLWVRQLITFDAAYGGERMMAYLFLPKESKPPFQTVVYFPGSNAIHTRSSKELKPRSTSEFILKSGRALIVPIYKSTYERHDGLKSDYPDQTIFWKDHIIMWTKDFGRTIDYLETRNDIDKTKLIYYGVSWGGAMGGIIPAVEKRIKGSLLLVAGLLFQPALAEVEPVNYLPRIKMPVLMLNGKYDFFFPYQTSQLPFYELLGTAQEDKKIIVYERGHSVPNTELIKESLAWLDKYLGPVK